MKIATELGLRIKKYRKEKGLTQGELSEKCALHATYIGQIERGEKNPSVDSVYKIAQALGISINLLFEEIDGFATDAEDASDALRAYHLISQLDEKDQAHMLQIIKSILTLKQS